MCKAVELFRQKMEENGLTGDVSIEDRPSRGRKVEITTQIFDSKRNHSKSYFIVIGDEGDADTLNMKKQVSIGFRNVYKDIKQSYSRLYSWEGRDVSFELYSEPSVKCMKCNTEVLLEDTGFFSLKGEMSVPLTKNVCSDDFLHSLDSHSKVCVKMYLLAVLNRDCTCVEQ